MSTRDTTSIVLEDLISIFATATSDRREASMSVTLEGGPSGPSQHVFRRDGDRVSAEPGPAPRQSNVEMRGGLTDLAEVASGAKMLVDLFRDGRVGVHGDIELSFRVLQQRKPAAELYCETVSRANPVDRIDRLQELSVDSFLAYRDRGRPFVLVEATRSWGLAGLGEERLRREFGLLPTEVLEGPIRRTTTLAEALDLFQKPAPDGSPYVSNADVPAAWQALVQRPPFYPEEQFRDTRMWLGPPGALTRLHRDRGDNFHAVVFGKKRFLLIAPHHRENLYTFRWAGEGEYDYCEVDPLHPDRSTHPRFAAVDRVHEVELGAGDMLFLPEGWFHQVHTDWLSLAFNFWIKAGCPAGVRSAETAPSPVRW